MSPDASHRQTTILPASALSDASSKAVLTTASRLAYSHLMPDVLEPPISPPKPRHPGLKPFTSETARIAAQKRHEADRLRAQQPEVPVIVATQDTQLARQAEDFATKRLMRVREQLERLDALMADTDDSKRFKELADASGRLTVQEALLANRPGPGTLKPGAKSSRRGSERIEPRMIGPAQQQPTRTEGSSPLHQNSNDYCI